MCIGIKIFLSWGPAYFYLCCEILFLFIAKSYVHRLQIIFVFFKVFFCIDCRTFSVFDVEYFHVTLKSRLDVNNRLSPLVRQAFFYSHISLWKIVSCETSPLKTVWLMILHVFKANRGVLRNDVTHLSHDTFWHWWSSKCQWRVYLLSIYCSSNLSTSINLQ